jgi:hypothetical protein
MTTRTVEYHVTLTATDCPDCAVVFGVPGRFLDERRKDKRRFFCPNGHSMSYQESEADRLRKRIAGLEGSLVAARDQRLAAERSNTALKGQITKARRRAAAGVCPCCHRTFQQLALHMSNKHPDHATTGQ